MNYQNNKYMKSLKQHVSESFRGTVKNLIFQKDFEEALAAHKEPFPLFTTNDPFMLDLNLAMTPYFNGTAKVDDFNKRLKMVAKHYGMQLDKMPKPSQMEDIYDIEQDVTPKQMEEAINTNTVLSKITGHPSIF
jgi:hypothetical protein